jgi:hypothetical protein
MLPLLMMVPPQGSTVAQPHLISLRGSQKSRRCGPLLIAWDRNTFSIPEIIYDPTLVLSLHVVLLVILFRVKAFKNLSTDGRVVDCPENLYDLRILKGLGQQELKLKDEIQDQFVFCQVVREVDGF